MGFAAGYLRFPITDVKHIEPQQHGFLINVPYYAAMSSVEMIYPETVLYVDGI